MKNAQFKWNFVKLAMLSILTIAPSGCGLKASDEQTCTKDSDCESNLKCVAFGSSHYCSLGCSSTSDCTGLGSDYVCYNPGYIDSITPQVCTLKCKDSFGECYNKDNWSCYQEPGSSTVVYACYPN